MQQNSHPTKHVTKSMKRVRFGETAVHEVPMWSQKEYVWYSSEEMYAITAQDLQRTIDRQSQLGEDKSIESNNYSWRGLENYSQYFNWQHVAIREYVQQVVARTKKGANEADDIRRMSKALTKDSRLRAQNMGKADFVNAYSDLLKDGVFFFRMPTSKTATMIVSSRYFVFPGLERQPYIAKLIK